MDNQELLQALEAMMDKKLNESLTPIKSELKSINERMAKTEERTTRIEILLENDISKKLNLLSEGQQIVVEKFHKLDALAEKVEDIQNTVEVLKAISVKK